MAKAMMHRPSEPTAAREDEAMLANAAPERDRAEDHGQGQPDLMDDRRAEQAAGRGEQPQQNRRGHAMHRAQAGQADRDAVQSGDANRMRCHGRPHIGEQMLRIQYIHRPNVALAPRLVARA